MSEPVNHCADCRHWGREGDESPMGYHLDIAHDYDETKTPVAPHRACVKVVHLNREGTSAVDVTRPAYLMDASGYMARLWTRPEFGCAEFERKEQP